MRLELEKYKGKRTRYTCPACGSRYSFARYIGDDGNYIDDSVGRCNRESNCNYHKKPKEFFAENPDLKSCNNLQPKKKARANYGFANTNNVRQEVVTTAPKQADYISNDILLRTLSRYEQNAFVQFLFNLFPEDAETVEKAIKDYLIGTTKNGKTIFWQIDGRRNVRTGKIIAYDVATGKRRKDVAPNWVHAELKRSGQLKPDFNLMQCFFGEHLLITEKRKPLAIVEAEKTAVIASICFPEFVWLACGAKQNLNAEKLQRFSGRRIILYPDGDAFVLWTEKAQEARSRSLTVKVSNLIETYAATEQKANGYDLADYLIHRQNEINEFNKFADNYNVKLKKVLGDDALKNQFNSIFDEQKAVMMIDGNLPETEAMRLLSDPANVRRIVSSLTL